MQKQTKSIAKRLRNAVIILVVTLAVIIFGAQFVLGPIIIEASEKFGPKILGTPVKVETAKFNILTGTCRFSGVVIGPPDGFKQNVFELGDLRIKVDVLSIFLSDTVVVKYILVEGPKATYELSGIRSNTGAIQKHLDDNVNRFQAKEQEKEQNEGQKVVVEKFSFKNGSVKIASATLGGGVPLPLPHIELTDIGKKSGGVTGLELTGQIFKSVGAGIFETVGDVLIGAGELVVEGVSAVGGAVVEGAEAVGGAVVEGVKAIGSGISSLFGSGDKKEE